MSEPQDGIGEDGRDEQPAASSPPPAGGVPDRQPADQAAIDRAFADLIAHFHDRRDGAADPSSRDSDGLPPDDLPPDDLPPDDLPPDQLRTPVRHDLDVEALFAAPEPEEADTGRAADEPAGAWRSYVPPPEPEERYTPPPAPWPHPSAPVLLGWLGIAAALLVMMVKAFGLGLPGWVGWLAVASFVGGFGVLISRLPRRRPPGSDDDGAVL